MLSYSDRPRTIPLKPKGKRQPWDSTSTTTEDEAEVHRQLNEAFGFTS